ncbi:hypothetical protein PS2_008775 [Malus domestica]
MKAFLFSLLKPQTPSSSPTNLLLLHRHHQRRSITKVRLKWVKNRSIDHIIETEIDLKAACLLKDAIKRSPTGFLTAKSFADWQKLLGLTVPVIRLLRSRYPTLFQEFPHARYANLPCFKLTDTADLGLPDGFEKVLVPKYPDCFRIVKASNGVGCLKAIQWPKEYAVSELQMSREGGDLGDEYRQIKKGETVLAFPMNFPRGYGGQKKVRAWMGEFQKLPYISPYEDSRHIDPKSDLMEKRVVGVLHEFLSLTLHKKTKRNYLRSLREELNLPHKFMRIITRYPGIFYLSFKCKTTTVSPREG